MFNEKRPLTSIKKNAQATKRTRRYVKILSPVIGLVLAVLIIAYVASLLFSQYGNFTITVKDYADRSYALTLSESSSFQTSTSKLTAEEVKNINNITYTSLPNDLNDVDGPHSGNDYLAYTFYVKNVGEKTCDYTYRLAITRATVGIDAAVRVRIYFTPDFYKADTQTYNRGGEYIDYAKPKTGGNGEAEVDPGNRVMTNFFNAEVVAQRTVKDFAVGDVAKFTVVIWLEGEDPDCTDDVLGGVFKTDMDIAIESES